MIVCIPFGFLLLPVWILLCQLTRPDPVVAEPAHVHGVFVYGVNGAPDPMGESLELSNVPSVIFVRRGSGMTWKYETIGQLLSTSESFAKNEDRLLLYK